MAPVKFERQTNRHQRTHAITRIGALLQLPRPQRQFLAPRVRVHPFHQTTAAMERPADCNIRFTSGSPISCIVLRRVANLSVMTTTSTMKTKITNKTKTKTIAAICPIQVPIPSPPRQKPNEKKKTKENPLSFLYRRSLDSAQLVKFFCHLFASLHGQLAIQAIYLFQTFIYERLSHCHKIHIFNSFFLQSNNLFFYNWDKCSTTSQVRVFPRHQMTTRFDLLDSMTGERKTATHFFVSPILSTRILNRPNRVSKI